MRLGRAFRFEGWRRATVVLVTALAVAASTTTVVMAIAGRSPGQASNVDQFAVRGDRLQVGPTAPPPAICGETDVVVVGDSLTVGADYFGDLTDVMAAAGYTAVVDGAVARFSSGGVTVLKSRLAEGTLEPLVIVALGTNDAAAGYTTSWFGSNVDKVMSTVGPSRVVVWVNLQMADTATAGRFNAVLASKALQYRNLLVADWASTPNSQYLTGDGLHYNTTGYKNRALFTADRADWATCRLPPP